MIEIIFLWKVFLLLVLVDKSSLEVEVRLQTWFCSENKCF
jgi:hypothetical protein